MLIFFRFFHFRKHYNYPMFYCLNVHSVKCVNCCLRRKSKIHTSHFCRVRMQWKHRLDWMALHNSPTDWGLWHGVILLSVLFLLWISNLKTALKDSHVSDKVRISMNRSNSVCPLKVCLGNVSRKTISKQGRHIRTVPYCTHTSIHESYW